MSDVEKKEASIPPDTMSSFPPGTPISEVREARDANFKRTRDSLHRLKKLSNEVLAGSGEYALDLEQLRKVPRT